MKVVVVVFLTLFPGVYDFGEWLLKWTWLGEEDDFQVILCVHPFAYEDIGLILCCRSSVMGIFPILMNIIQFWLIDSIVKASSIAAVSLDIEQGHDDEPLFQGDSDDEVDYRHRRSSSLSNPRRIDTLDDHSFANISEIMIPKESVHHVDSHSYPPSLSGSLSSNLASTHEPKLPRVAKNLAKQTQRLSHNIANTLSETPCLSGSSSLPRTPPHATHVPAVTESANWAETWDDADEWDHQKNDAKGD